MKLKRFVMFCLLSSLALSSEIKLERLEELRKKNLISQEDYQILKSEITPTNQESMYTLKINGSVKDNFYPVVKKGGSQYLNVNKFLDSIGISGYYEKDRERIRLTLGENFRKVDIDARDNSIVDNGKKLSEDTSAILAINNNIYLREDVFKKLFTYRLIIDEKTSKISISLNFTPPAELLTRLDLKAKALKSESKIEDLQYESKRQLFELGYLRVQLDEVLSRDSSKKAFSSTWDGSLQYQGGLLYGQLQANYNIRENTLNSALLEYNEIWEGHTFKIQNNAIGKSNNNWEFSFFKDKSYFTEGKRVIIRESVPIGSRVELKYMGFPIAIQNEIGGVVEFDNPVITTDRTYTLVIYSPTGETYEKTIKTVQDYDLQNKGEFQYNLYIKEDNKSSKYTTNLGLFYGITNNLTLGANYLRGVEDVNGDYKYVQVGTANIVYGGNYNGLSYVLRLNFEKYMDNYENSGKKFEDRYSYGGVTQLNYGNLQYTFTIDEFGKYYDEERTLSNQIQYNLGQYIRLYYEYDKTFKYIGSGKEEMRYGVSLDKAFGPIFFNAEYNGKHKGESEFSISAYYTTRNNISTRWENRWTNDGKNFETLLSIYNNNFKGIIDYSLELGYSDQYKEKATFKFSMKLFDWLNITSEFDKKGNSTNTVGIDKIIDLKNPMTKVDSMDNSRVKVITFIDENNNNIWDKGEKLIEGVEVTLGQKTVTTNENGEGMFYGVSNGIVHNLKPTIKKPSFTLGDNKITVKGTFSSTIYAYIPIKPMLNLSGQIHIDDDLGLTELEKEELYQNLLVEIKDVNGNSIELSIPDNTGSFDVSGLYPKLYTIEVTYLGTRYDLKKVSELLKLAYNEEEFDNIIAFKISSDKISMLN